MNPEQSHKLVKQTFQADFDRQRFVEFIDKLLKRVDFKKQFMQSGLNIRRAFIDKVNSFERVGQYIDADGKIIDILIVNLKKDLTLERGRTGLRNFAADYLQSDRGVGKSAVLIAYVSNTQTDWRFSYVTLEKDLKQNEKGAFKEEITKLTPARRYSFLVGKFENSHTAQRQFFDLLNNPAPKLQNVEDAFNIEKVTKEFFGEYKLLFEKVRGELDKLCTKNKAVRDEFIGKGMFAYAKDEDGEELLDRDGNKVKEPFTDDFAKKLLGQIVFLYFLQKKGWFGVERDNQWGTGDKNFLRTLFSNNAASSNFFDSVLEPLFYNALAVKREHDWSDRFNCKIPFLNGGLFEPLNGYDWVHIELNLPNTLFSNTETSTLGDKGTGILDVFDRYNFTINEAEPLEVEVAVDPEMLGKIFENLLPENIRHGSGTYYTPRVIVAYMCQQSLINYLVNRLEEVPREDLETFIRFGSQQRDYTEAGTQSQAEKFLPQSIIENASGINDELKQITVCDPAVGSGAFPVGMMLEIVKAREALQSVEGIERLSQYDLKRQTIESCLYGVDLDSGAVEIAKLRLWLSLIVDEAEFKTIEPLPNLDYKIMQGNSLLDEFHGVKLVNEKLFTQNRIDKQARANEIDEEIAHLSAELGKSNVGKQSPMYVLTERRITELKKEKTSLSDDNSRARQSDLFLPADKSHTKLEELKRKHKEIFDETRKDVKERLRSEAEKLEWEFIEAKLKSDGKVKELVELETQRNERRKNYFLWQLNFPEVFEQGGFDVVIGNPPYGLLNKRQNQRDSVNVSAEELAYYRTSPKYKPALGGMINIFRLFIVSSTDILRKGGIFAEIFPLAFVGDVSASNLRKNILEKYEISRIEAFPERDNEKKRVFESVKMSVCILVLQKRSKPNSKFFVRINSDRFIDEGAQKVYLDAETIATIDATNCTIPLLSPKELDVIKDVYSKANPLSTYGHCYTGELDLTLGKKYLTDNPKDSVLLKGAIIDKYLIRTKMSQGEIKFLDSKRFLRENSGKKVRHSQARRIVMQAITGVNEKTRLKMTIIDKNIFCANSVNYVVFEDEGFSLEYALGLLNSKLMNFVFSKSSTNSNVNGYEIDNLPLMKADKGEQQRIGKLVEQVLSRKRENIQADTSNLEAAIDKEVYRLFALSAREIDVIEGTR